MLRRLQFAQCTQARCTVQRVWRCCSVASLTPCPNLPHSFLLYHVWLCACCVLGVGACARVDISVGAGLVRRIQKLKFPACGEAGCDCTRGTGNASDASCRVAGAPEEEEEEEERLRQGQQRGMEVDAPGVIVNGGARVTTALAQQTAREGKGGDAREESLEEEEEEEEEEGGAEESEDEMLPYYINDWANFTASREKILDMAKECALSASLSQNDIENSFALYTQRS